jgi:hypothetical protein
MAGIIGRLYKNTETLTDGKTPNPDYQPDKPLCWMEYFCEAEGKFVLEENRATIYPSHGAADDTAALMRAENKFGFVFGITHARTPPPPPSMTHPYGERIHREPSEAHEHLDKRKLRKKQPKEKIKTAAEHATTTEKEIRLPYRDD